MARQTKEQLLADIRKNKRNRSLEEAQALLENWGFTPRAAAKEQGGVWVRGSQTVTLPRPHGGKPLGPTYISIIIRAIEAAEAEDELKKQNTDGQGGNGWKKKT